jgi:putative spermidine/putrescine transport system ATP-binding protein
MDEPLGALDKKLRAHLQVELKQIQRQLGITVVYVTHDQDEALTMSDRIAIMHEGRVMQVGVPMDLYDSPRSAFVADFLGESNMLTATIESVSGGSSVARLGAGASVRVQSELLLGRTYTLAIRPERLRLGHGGEAIDAFRGTVTDVVFGGDVTRIWVQADRIGRLLLKQQNGGDRRRVDVGERVELSWAARDLSAFLSEGP